MEFNPPIENRGTDELILISKSSTADYQAKAIELAIAELTRRQISPDIIEKRYNELFEENVKEAENIITEMATEDYSILEKIWIVLFWPRELLHGWYLKRDGYALKANNRMKLLLIGVALYALTFIIS